MSVDKKVVAKKDNEIVDKRETEVLWTDTTRRKTPPIGDHTHQGIPANKNGALLLDLCTPSKATLTSDIAPFVCSEKQWYPAFAMNGGGAGGKTLSERYLACTKPILRNVIFQKLMLSRAILTRPSGMKPIGNKHV